jgi:hypothetical protein
MRCDPRLVRRLWHYGAKDARVVAAGGVEHEPIVTVAKAVGSPTPSLRRG